ncbi:MAG: hypothetical protein WC683_02870 [bacterium]
MKIENMRGRMSEHNLTSSSPIPSGGSQTLMYVAEKLVQLVDVWETTGALYIRTVTAGRRTVFDRDCYRTYEPVVLRTGERVTVLVENPTREEWNAHVMVSTFDLTDIPEGRLYSFAVRQPESDLRERFARAANLSPSTATVEQIEARIGALVNDAESIYGSKLAAWKKIAHEASDLYEKEIASREDAAAENQALRNQLRIADERIGTLHRCAQTAFDQLRKAGIRPRLDGFGP